MIKAIVLIKMVTGEVKAAMRDLSRVRSVTEAHITFGPYDALAILEVKDLKEVGQVVYWDIQTIPGVLSTTTCLMTEFERPEAGRDAAFSDERTAVPSR